MNSNDNLLHKKGLDMALFKRLFAYTKGYRKMYVFILFLAASSTGLGLLVPFVNGKILEYLGEKDIDFNKIFYLVIALTLCIFLSLVIQYFQNILLHKQGNKIIYSVRSEVFEKIESLSIKQLNNIPVGKMVTRVGSDVNVLYELYTNVLVNLTTNVFTIIGVVIFMFVLHAKLALITLIVCPVVVVLSYIFRKASRKAHRKVRNCITDVNSFLSENISGMKITQIFNQEEKKLREFDERNNALKKASFKEIIVFAVFRPSIYVLYILMIVLVLWTGSNEIIRLGANTVLTYSLLFTFYQYVDRFFSPLQQLAEQFNVLQSAFASSERIFEMLDTESDIVEEEDAIEAEHLLGEIEFKNVWFKYVEDEWVLKDVSFKVNAKETVAFVGATGSGKTTILSLIVRNYDIQKGQILIDGIDIKKYKISSLRKNIGQMLQDVFLFSGTIESNIKMKDENISLEDIKHASEYVNADKFIEDLPNKYLEEVRERGNNFSSGQRQLLSFARTIVHKPNIMILDEATANIDSETEILIQDSLEKMMNIGTMLIVAHRLSTIQHADKIIVLRKGEIIEEGSHQELLKQKGQYYKLYQLQYHHNLESVKNNE